MRTIVKILVIAFLAIGLVSCSDTTSAQVGEGRELGPSGYKVHFELKNDSGQEIFAYQTVEKRTACSLAGSSWLSIERDGDVVRPGENDSFCTCEEQQELGECGISTPMCAGPERSNSVLSSGESRQFEWDGRVWESNDRNCVTAELVAGEPLEATICYGREFSDESFRIVEPTCQTIEFTVDQPEQTVSVVVPPL